MARVDDLSAPYVDPSGTSGKAVGLVVGVSSPSLRVVVGFGATSAGGATPPAPDTIFEIGSVTKVFTGYLLAQGVARGELGLDDAIDPYFPMGAPHYNGKPITLLDLATHTSGLPNFPSNLHAGYTAQDLETFLGQYSLTVEPGTVYGYSNLGAGTLGYVTVEAASAASYDSLIKAGIADPLGLPDTRIELSSAQASRLVQGYRKGMPAPPINIGEPLSGGGALRSTGEDVLTFVEAAVGRGPKSAAATWQDVLAPRRPSPNGENGQTGLLINLEDWNGRTLYSKDGGTPGFHAHIMLTTDPPVALVLLSNAGDLEGLHDLGKAILTEALALEGK